MAKVGTGGLAFSSPLNKNPVKFYFRGVTPFLGKNSGDIIRD
jgi:hypothetical protein